MKLDTRTNAPKSIAYGRMWPREIFYRRVEPQGHDLVFRRPTSLLFRTIDLLTKPGVYVLYRDDMPYYVGQANRLRSRLWKHACDADSRYFNHWNFFSFFVIEGDDKKARQKRAEVESILIAAMPTANGAKPLLKRKPFPKDVNRMVREMQSGRTNPLAERALKATAAAENEREP